MSEEKISFIAALPTSTAIKIYGQDGNAKVTFDVPASELAQVLKLVLLVGQAFRVIIENERN